MRRNVTCADCGASYTIDSDVCPHCGRQGPSPNVSWASLPEERDALLARYTAATEDLGHRGLAARQSELEALLLASEICRALPQAELQRLFSSDSQVATTYQQQVEGCARMPDSDADFDRFRRAAETALFGAATGRIHYAALTPNGDWLPSYGDGAVFFQEDHVSHRATLFEDNVVLWLQRRGIPPVAYGGPGSVPPGHRAEWNTRSLLGVAKLSPLLNTTASLTDMILHAGETTMEDSFLEVHIFGPYTVRSIKRVIVCRDLFGRAAWTNLIQTSAKHGIVVQTYTLRSIVNDGGSK